MKKYELAVDIGGLGSGFPIEVYSYNPTRYRIHTNYKGIDLWFNEKQADLLIQQGIIREVQGPVFTEEDIKAIIHIVFDETNKEHKDIVNIQWIISDYRKKKGI